VVDVSSDVSEIRVGGGLVTMAGVGSGIGKSSESESESESSS